MTKLKVAKRGEVYFVRCTLTGRIKVGFTAGKVSARFDVLQSSSPTRLEFLGSVAADQGLEERLHGRLRSACVGGEWFAPERRVMAVVRAYLGMQYPYDPNGMVYRQVGRAIRGAPARP